MSSPSKIESIKENLVVKINTCKSKASNIYENNVKVANKQIEDHFTYLKGTIGLRLKQDPISPLRIYAPCKNFVQIGIDGIKEDIDQLLNKRIL